MRPCMYLPVLQNERLPWKLTEMWATAHPLTWSNCLFSSFFLFKEAQERLLLLCSPSDWASTSSQFQTDSTKYGFLGDFYWSQLKRNFICLWGNFAWEFVYPLNLIPWPSQIISASSSVLLPPKRGAAAPFYRYLHYNFSPYGSWRKKTQTNRQPKTTAGKFVHIQLMR